MPAAELTQKVGYCTIRSMSRVCYIEKNDLPGTAGNSKNTALKELIIIITIHIGDIKLIQRQESKLKEIQELEIIIKRI